METFETYRGYLFAVAYRMLGSAMDAEDMVQETFLRYQTHRPEHVDSLKAYLTTILTRLCMDQLQLARRKREVYVGPWLPEPIQTTAADEATASATSADPERRVDMQESISLAFLTLLEQLQPFERAVFLLREVFGYEFAEIAAILEKSEAACRRSFSRAKLHLQTHRPRFAASAETQRRLLTGFYQAVIGGDMGALTGMLAEDVSLWADAGGKVKGAASRPVFGREHVARFLLGTPRLLPENARAEFEEVNGQTALIVRVGDQNFFVMTIDVDDAGYAQTIRIVANPDKLARV
ncbi:MAG TPA: RNA polymerase sigma-70 factor [Ktedonobacterales bacterium]|nr:RNA polymerase sigma-70 factor [Ktedonobacterales bacterium]